MLSLKASIDDLQYESVCQKNEGQWARVSEALPQQCISLRDPRVSVPSACHHPFSQNAQKDRKQAINHHHTCSS